MKPYVYYLPLSLKPSNPKPFNLKSKDPSALNPELQDPKTPRQDKPSAPNSESPHTLELAAALTVSSKDPTPVSESGSY